MGNVRIRGKVQAVQKQPKRFRVNSESKTNPSLKQSGSAPLCLLFLVRLVGRETWILTRDSARKKKKKQEKKETKKQQHRLFKLSRCLWTMTLSVIPVTAKVGNPMTTLSPKPFTIRGQLNKTTHTHSHGLWYG